MTTTATKTLATVIVYATTASGHDITVVQSAGNNTLTDFATYWAELVKAGEYTGATVKPYTYA